MPVGRLLYCLGEGRLGLMLIVLIIVVGRVLAYMCIETWWRVQYCLHLRGMGRGLEQASF